MADLDSRQDPSEEYGRHRGEELMLENASLFDKMKNLSYVTFMLIGIALLWPWNCFLSASLYFQHDVFHDDTIYAKIYISTMMSISTISSVAFNFWLSKRQHSYAERVVRGLVWEVLVFGLLCVFVLVHGAFPEWLNFVFLMGMVLVSSCGTAMTQNGAMALANVFGPQFSQSVMMGQGIAGVLPSLVLFAVSFIGDPRDQSVGGIFAYFCTTVVVSASCIVLYRASGIGRADKHKLLGGETNNNEADDTVSFSILYQKLKFLVLSIFTTFVVTLLFPVFAANTFVAGLPMHNSQYIPFIFTVWNLGDLYGRAISGYPFFQSAKFTPYKTFLYSISRIGLVPLFFCFNLNDSMKPSTSVLSDFGYIILQFVFGLTNGNVLSVCFMKVSPQLGSDKERRAAGGFTNIFLSSGLAFGSLLSYVFVYIVSTYRAGGA
ncbi:LANO_0C02300g1_1 [Lachancea nothofagi CBS 11611]|uniref:LANO_0C02300g1_1 n=1 Tax=Lachancea nothofagi CBS 11611 TaxID=1266666 RepID=A0A1G4J4N0_9SACH|nr:LANO_0C02300g1_1 [Lachancea nothofagi CBS 11611]